MTMNNQTGQMLILAIIVVVLVLINVLAIISGAQLFSQNTNYTNQSAAVLNLAEAGIDKALASLNITGGSYTGETETVLGSGSFSVSITSSTPNTKIIESTGYIPSKENAKVKKTVRMSVAKGVGVAFNYGIQAGEGGLQMEENSRINGSVYSNGNIKMQNNSAITGDAWVAAGIEGVPAVQNDCSTSCGDFIFGKVVNGQARFDVAQSFFLSSVSSVNKVAIKLKKINNPADITVRILGNSSREGRFNRPNRQQVFATGILYSGLVTSSYSFVEVAFPNPPQLSANERYWLLLDTTGNSDYWSWSNGFEAPNEEAKYTHDWYTIKPEDWKGLSGHLDLKVYVGGVASSIEGLSGANIGGDAHANTLKNLTITKGAYYQVKENVTAASYHPNSPDPPAKVMPISEGNIAEWKSSAEAAGVYTGNISSCRSELGPGKYVGNISFSNNCTVTIKGTVWIIGNLNLDNNVTLKLDPSFGTASGVIIVDGQVDLSNNVKLQGSGTDGSFLMTLSTYNSQTSGLPAIDVKNGGNSGILYASSGIAKIENNNHLNELTAWKIDLENGVTVDYDSGLASSFFTSGPSGSYSLIKGTYQIK
ncbi:MAG: hypothetical protein Q7R97_02785 [Candidatus Daviesbacteria bacterium]|nr:hypothetical protein [Candidatus Daviesbacteria bacterium]